MRTSQTYHFSSLAVLRYVCGVAVAVAVEVAVAVLLSSGTPVNFIWVEQFRTRRLQSDNLYKPANIIW